jgi:hypothetical protein
MFNESLYYPRLAYHERAQGDEVRPCISTLGKIVAAVERRTDIVWRSNAVRKDRTTATLRALQGRSNAQHRSRWLFHNCIEFLRGGSRFYGRRIVLRRALGLGANARRLANHFPRVRILGRALPRQKFRASFKHRRRCDPQVLPGNLFLGRNAEASLKPLAVAASANAGGAPPQQKCRASLKHSEGACDDTRTEQLFLGRIAGASLKQGRRVCRGHWFQSLPQQKMPGLY